MNENHCRGWYQGDPILEKYHDHEWCKEKSFDAYIWSFTDGKQVDGQWQCPEQVPTVSDVSKKMSADMKKRGIGFVGPVITYSFLQAVGIVNDHLINCEYR